ncbi:MAG: polysaccharide deacetylase family protein [candidate division KSB1 bacterium]|nr:polysaccharide deacetylase family protein [candidate division KSB1 bacterium]MDZ7336511.1 polysaccharide deacetylase family protein [candidate division KSB1 bacterium]
MVVITFDDGYQDNYTNAFPILKKYAVPATIFLSTDPIQNGTRLWYDAIQETILGSSQKHIDLSAFGLGEFEIITAKQKDHAIHQITDHVKKFMNGCRKEEITEYLETRYSTNDDAGNSQWLMLNWDQIKEMARSGITFGAHTMTHPILTQISTEEAQREIQLSRKIIEENIGMKVDLFAYPNGNADDYNDKIIDLVKSEGFSAACTLIPGVNRRNNLYALYRLGIDNEFTGISNHFTKEIFASELAGIFDLLFFRFIRR